MRAGRAIAEGLRLEGMAVDAVHDGAAGWSAPGNDYDVIVLDRDLPGVHGDEVCAHARRDGPGADPHADRRAARSRTGSAGWAAARTTTCPSRSRSPSSSPGSGRSAGAPTPPRRRC